MGQVGGLLGGDGDPARRGTGHHARRVAAALADARPGGRGRARRSGGRDAQLLQRRRLDGDRGAAARGHARRASRLAGAAGQSTVRTPRARRAGRAGSGCSWSTKRTRSPTGVTTSGPTTAGWPICCRACTPTRRCSPPPLRPTPASPTTSRPSSASRPLVLRGRLARDSLHLAVVDQLSPLERYAWVVDHLPRLPGSGIVYTLTVADAERLATVLAGRARRTIRVAAYTGGLDSETRERLEDDASSQPAQGAGRDVGAGHGLRQARPRLRRPRRLTAEPGVVLPAGRPRRPRDRRGPGHLAAVHRRRGGVGLLRHGHHPRPEPGRAAAVRPGSGTRTT